MQLTRVPEGSIEEIQYRIVQSPIGEFLAGATPGGCCLFEFHDRGGLDRIKARIHKRYRLEMTPGSGPVLDQVEDETREYFEGRRQLFSVPLDIRGTPFEKSVWGQLMRIPYGTTRSYGDIAAKLGKPGAARAVGRANGANYMPIIIPCHRVIEADGNLRGFGGGLWRKQYLLDLEMRHRPEK
jgi:AraC family transcriptional regulator, regulatory protein of adaptative response / methylated-DNA-[protein]-cysteine methyltransferase